MSAPDLDEYLEVVRTMLEDAQVSERSITLISHSLRQADLEIARLRAQVRQLEQQLYQQENSHAHS